MERRTVPNVEAAVNKFLDWFSAEVISSFFGTEFDRDSAEYVLTEVMNNAWEHGNGKNSAKKITVEWSVGHDCLTIAVEDEGKGFTPVIPDAPPPSYQSRGRGLMSIKEMVAALSFNERGNRITLTFKGEN